MGLKHKIAKWLLPEIEDMLECEPTPVVSVEYKEDCTVDVEADIVIFDDAVSGGILGDLQPGPENQIIYLISRYGNTTLTYNYGNNLKLQEGITIIVSDGVDWFVK